MQKLLLTKWFKQSVSLTLVATLLTLIPLAPIAIVGAVALITVLPGRQIVRWLGLYEQRWSFEKLTLSLALGLVTSPILIYWSSLLFGYSRVMLLIVFPAYIVALAAWVSRNDFKLAISQAPISLPDSSRLSWIIAACLIGFTLVGVFLAYFELNTGQGFYPVQMEDWQKHYGVAFSLRHTGIPPSSMFFYGMFPDEQLVYYYFLHLSGASLDLLAGGGPMLHYAFVTAIMLAALSFGTVFLLLARTIFNSQKAAVWALAFASIIGGLDIIPITHRAVQKYREHFPEGPLPWEALLPGEHIDNWVSALSLRLNSFYGYYIWVPQHLTGLTIFCLGCYLYLKVEERGKLLIIYPLLLFALLGHSTWIAVIVAGGLFLFALLHIATTYQKQGMVAARTLFLGYAMVAVGFVLVATPFILTLVGPNAPKSGIAFEIPKLDSWRLLRPFQANFDSAVWARILDLPLHFFIEMGALLVAGLAGLILFWGRQKSDSPTPEANDPSTTHYAPSDLLPFWTLLLFIGISTVSLFASGRGWVELGLTQNNDLGLRALMPGQLVLALFGGYFMANLATLKMARWGKMLTNGVMLILIGLGISYAAWEFFAMGLAKYTVKPQLAATVYQTLQDMPEVTVPQDKVFPVVLHRQHRDASRFQLSLGGRPVGYSTGEAVVFHRDVHSLALALELSKEAFDNGLPVWSYQMFKGLGADYIFVGPAEREAIRHPEKYQHPQYFRPVYEQGDFEIYEVRARPYPHNDTPPASFDYGAIEFEGYFIDTVPRYPGNQAEEQEGQGLVTAWRLTTPTTKNYTVYIHLVDAEGNIVDQADHQLWAWDVKGEGPTSIWTPNLTHLDIVPVPKAALTADTPLSIRLGLWLPDSGEYFLVDTQILTVDEVNRLVVGGLER